MERCSVIRVLMSNLFKLQVGRRPATRRAIPGDAARRPQTRQGRSGRRRLPRSPAGQAAPRAGIPPRSRAPAPRRPPRPRGYAPVATAAGIPSASGRPAGATTTSDDAIISSTIGHGPESAPNLKPRNGTVTMTPAGSHSSAATMNSPARNGHQTPAPIRSGR